MSISMSSLTLFSLAFISPTDRDVEFPHSFIILCLLANFLLLRTNPSISLLVASCLLLVGGLAMSRLFLLHELTAILFVNTLACLVYNYHYSAEISLVKCSTIFYIFMCLGLIGSKSSLAIKLIRKDSMDVSLKD